MSASLGNVVNLIEEEEGDCIANRLQVLYKSKRLADLDILVSDENWWFGDTVKDFYGHKLILAIASPIFNQILDDEEGGEENSLNNLIAVDDVSSSSISEASFVTYNIGEDDDGNLKNVNEKKKIIKKMAAIDPIFDVTVELKDGYERKRLEIDGIPPIVMEALLEFIYFDRYQESDFDFGYSRNLLWRLWHSSLAFNIPKLAEKTTKTIYRTMCEDTVFWDLNYAMRYKPLGKTESILDQVEKIVKAANERLYENPNFVWLDYTAITEILTKRQPGTCDPYIILNNLLRWILYQIDRNACNELTGGSQLRTANESENSATTIQSDNIKKSATSHDVLSNPTTSNNNIMKDEIDERLNWIRCVQNGEQTPFAKKCDGGTSIKHSKEELRKYMDRGLCHMPWTEFSQADLISILFAEMPASSLHLMQQAKITQVCKEMMQIVVRNPKRLKLSLYQTLTK